MTYVILVQREGRESPSLYVEQGSTPYVVPEGCRRGTKLYTEGRAFELVYGTNYRSRRALVENIGKLWQEDMTLVKAARTRDDGATVQIHGLV